MNSESYNFGLNSRRIVMKNVVERLKNVLTYTEIQAIKAVVDGLGEETSGVVNTSKAIEGVNITKSIAVSAMKLLEAAGVIETRSLGMKGTHIKVFDKDALKEVIGII